MAEDPLEQRVQEERGRVESSENWKWMSQKRLAVGMGGGSPQGCVGTSRGDHRGSGLGEKAQVPGQGPKPVHVWLLQWLAVSLRARQHGTMVTRARIGSGLRRLESKLAQVLAGTPFPGLHLRDNESTHLKGLCGVQ